MALEEEFDIEIPDEEAEKSQLYRLLLTTLRTQASKHPSCPGGHPTALFLYFPRRISVSERRVVVTGLGMLSPVGNTVDSSRKAVCAGRVVSA